MRPSRLSAMCGPTLRMLPPRLISMKIASGGRLAGPPTVTSCVGVSALLCSRQGYAATAEHDPERDIPDIRHLPTASEADVELHLWVNSAAGVSSSPMPSLSLSGKSLVLCVAALQLHEAALATQDRNSARLSGLVYRYLSALALHISTRFNAPGKPSAAAVLYADVESAHIRPESLRTSLQYLAHRAFQSSGGAATARDDGNHQISSDSSPTLVDLQIAERDLELTIEATIVLLEGHQILQIHRASVAAKKNESVATTAAMMPHAESACFHITSLLGILSKPLSAHEVPSLEVVREREPPAILPFPATKRVFWAHTSKQLTSVLYIVLLSAQSGSLDARIIENMFRNLLRNVYGAEAERFGVSRSLHYTATVVLPYMLTSFSVVVDILRRQQRSVAAVTATETSVAVKNKIHPREKTRSGTHASSHGSSSPTGTPSQGRGAAVAGRIMEPSSERSRRVTLMVLCLAAALYMVSSRTELRSSVAPSSPSLSSHQRGEENVG